MESKTDKKIYYIDAKGQILGRLSTKIANILRGKDKVEFVPYLNIGNKVVVYNIKHIILTGRKLEQKKYFRHSGYLGHLKEKTAEDLMSTNPTEIIRHSVIGMLPKNKLRSHWMKNLQLYSEKPSNIPDSDDKIES